MSVFHAQRDAAVYGLRFLRRDGRRFLVCSSCAGIFTLKTFKKTYLSKKHRQGPKESTAAGRRCRPALLAAAFICFHPSARSRSARTRGASAWLQRKAQANAPKASHARRAFHRPAEPTSSSGRRPRNRSFIKSACVYACSKSMSAPHETSFLISESAACCLSAEHNCITPGRGILLPRTGIRVPLLQLLTIVFAVACRPAGALRCAQVLFFVDQSQNLVHIQVDARHIGSP